ncbi:MAG: PleD family two-component system response regulator [Candidatus Hermodarchaeota archaeon]
MEEFNTNNQANLIRIFVHNNIDYINAIFKKKPLLGAKEYDENYFDDFIRKAIDRYEECNGNGFHEELKQKISPLKLTILMLENDINEPEALLGGINNIKNALEELENLIKRRFEAPKLIRFVKKVDILYIEDNELERKTIDAFFKSKGMNIKSVETSEEALYLLNTMTPKVILIDVNLKTSKIDGDKFCKMVRSNGEYKSVPIILISAIVSKKDKENVLNKTGADDIIIKPIDKLADLNILFKYLKQN